MTERQNTRGVILTIRKVASACEPDAELLLWLSRCDWVCCEVVGEEVERQCRGELRARGRCASMVNDNALVCLHLPSSSSVEPQAHLDFGRPQPRTSFATMADLCPRQIKPKVIDTVAVLNQHRTRAPPTFHPWPRLSTDLQLLIVDVLVLRGRSKPLISQTHRYYTDNGHLLALLHTNRQIRTLALRSHYTYGIVLSYPAKSFQYPKPRVSPFIRRVELQIIFDGGTLRRHLKKRCCSMFEPGDFSILVNKEWQATMHHVEHLQIIVEAMSSPLRQMSLSYRKPSLRGPAPCLREDSAFKYWEPYQMFLHPTTLSVVVQGFECGDHVPGAEGMNAVCKYECAGKLARAIEGMVILKSEVRDSLS
jgi:hypothetical protein